MTTPSLARFLLARIAEDEAMAEAAAAHAPGGEWSMYDPDAGTGRAGRFACVGTGGMHPTAWPQHAAHMTRHDPARVLAECEAKRRIVEMWKKADHDPFRSELPSGRAKARALEVVLMHLALPYADHPDYQQEWRP